MMRSVVVSMFVSYERACPSRQSCPERCVSCFPAPFDVRLAFGASYRRRCRHSDGRDQAQIKNIVSSEKCFAAFPLDSKAQKARDYYDHDHHADDIKDVHCVLLRVRDAICFESAMATLGLGTRHVSSRVPKRR